MNVTPIIIIKDVVHGSNSNHHHHGCLDIYEIYKSCNQEWLGVDQIPIITIKDGWTNMPLLLYLLLSLIIRLFISINCDDYWNFIIIVRAFFMMIFGIWSMYKHPWWWLLEFYPCQSILGNDDWDLIPVQASSMMIIGI